MQRAMSNRSGFTLIELLVVIAIMGILITFAIPAFESMGRGSAARTAATQLAATMTYARQQAVVSGSNVYIVFPHGDSTLYANAAQRAMALRSYSVYSERDGYLRNWVYLPKGIVFVPTEASFPDPIVRDSKSIFSELGQASGGIKEKVEASVPFPDNSGNVKTMRVLAFSPDGAAYSMNGNLRGPDAEILISEGTIDPLAGGTIVPDFRSVQGSALYAILLNPLTGQNRIEDFRYF